MKVLHINANYCGTTLHQAMMDELDGLCDNAVFVPTHDAACGVVKIGDNVSVCQCFRKWDRAVFSYKQRKILRALQTRYDVGNFDLLHAYTLFTDGNVAYKLHKKYGIPYVVAVRSTDIIFFKYRPHLRGRGMEILRNASAVFFLSATYRDQLIERYVPPKYQAALLKKVHILPNGIDEFWFCNGQSHAAPKKNPLRLIFAGRIDRNKNLTTSAKACELLRQRGYDAQLTAVGPVTDASILEELRGLEYVTFLPKMGKEALAQIYRKQDIFVMPSHFESFGLVYAEAMSQGLPVIYTRGQGFDKQFPEGTVGYAVDSKKPEEIVSAIEAILEDYEPMSARCVENSRVFRWSHFVQEYHQIYRQCKQTQKECQ